MAVEDIGAKIGSQENTQTPDFTNSQLIARGLSPFTPLDDIGTEFFLLRGSISSDEIEDTRTYLAAELDSFMDLDREIRKKYLDFLGGTVLDHYYQLTSSVRGQEGGKHEERLTKFGQFLGFVISKNSSQPVQVLPEVS